MKDLTPLNFDPFELGVEMTEGGIGQIAVKSSTMIQGYYKNDAATARQFGDGYFLTGDIGRLLPSRKLQLLGRCDDVLNLGGLKLPPDSIEAKLKSVDGVIDVAATSIFSDQSIGDLCIAVIRGNDSNREAIVQQIITNVSSLC
jgi:acyl-CoA synthetase (AMP-forming)/AMP-acid ligase II